MRSEERNSNRGENDLKSHTVTDIAISTVTVFIINDFK